MNLDQLKHGVFKIHTSGGSGSGFYLSTVNLFVTNYHVVEGNKKVAVENQQQDRYVAKVVYVNPDVDIAFLKTETYQPDTSVRFDKVHDVQSGYKVFVLGFPFGLPYTITEGIVSSERQLIE